MPKAGDLAGKHALVTGTRLALDARAVGGTLGTYLWSLDGADIPGATNHVLPLGQKIPVRRRELLQQSEAIAIGKQDEQLRDDRSDT